MGIVKKTVIGVAAALVLLTVVGFFLPRTVRLVRETTIAAPRATVFRLVNGFTYYPQWSPWAALDPATVYTYSGPKTGVGAKIEWVGDPATVGTGMQEVTASDGIGVVQTRLEFGRRVTAMTTITLTETTGGTRVVWSLESDVGLNPFARYLGVFLNPMVGGDFQRGLDNLKRVAEENAQR